MAIIRWEPFRMEDFPELRLPRFGSDLSVDVYEKGNDVIAEMHLAGVNPEDIDIDVEDDFVRVSGSREEQKENMEADYYYKEIQRGTFERSFRLPTKVNSEKANAEFEDGVLTITMPKLQEKKTGKLKVVSKTEKQTPTGLPKKEAKKTPPGKTTKK